MPWNIILEGNWHCTFSSGSVLVLTELPPICRVNGYMRAGLLSFWFEIQVLFPFVGGALLSMGFVTLVQLENKVYFYKVIQILLEEPNSAGKLLQCLLQRKKSQKFSFIEVCSRRSQQTSQHRSETALMYSRTWAHHKNKQPTRHGELSKYYNFFLLQQLHKILKILTGWW